MRLGVLSTSYPRAPGDPAGAFVAAFARWLAGRGHTVEVVAAGPGAPRDGDLRVTRVHAGARLFYDEGAPERLERSVAARARAPLFSAALLVAAARRAPGWDRIVSHWLLPCGLVGAALRRPQLAIAHSADVFLAARPGVADAVAAALVASRTRVAFVAEHLRARLLGAIRSRRLARSLRDRSLVCPMGIDVAALAAARAGDQAAARRRLGVPDDRPVVAFLGRLVPVKGVQLLAAAAPPGVTLLVAGDGPLRGALPPRAVVAGELRGAARDDLFRAADVLCVPSLELPGGRTEGAPLVVLEALAAGVPLVASDLAGVRELAGDAAWSFPAGDRGALAAAIRAALAGDAARLERGRRRAAERDWELIGPRLLEALLGA
jgi:glycosyltransferase involved in cell wall biosynthesis